MLSRKTAARLKVENSSKPPATGSKETKTYVDDKMNQASVKLDARNARVAEPDARAKEVEKQLEHSVSQMRVAECKFLLLHDET